MTVRCSRDGRKEYERLSPNAAVLIHALQSSMARGTTLSVRDQETQVRPRPGRWCPCSAASAGRPETNEPLPAPASGASVASQHALDIKHLRMLRAVIANERLQLPASLKDDMERTLARGHLRPPLLSQAHPAKRLRFLVVCTIQSGKRCTTACSACRSTSTTSTRRARRSAS